MEMLSYTCNKITGLLKNKKNIFLLLFAIMTIVSFIKIPLVIAQTQQRQNDSLVVSSDVSPVNNNSDSETTQGKDKKNFQRIIPLSSPLYTEMDRLYLLAGKSRPSLSRPWSADEAKKIMEALPKNLLGSISENSFDIIKREIEFGNEKTGSKKAFLKISPEINIEGYFKTNDDREEWEHGYEKRAPFIHVPFEGWFFTSLYMDIDFSLKQEHAVANATDNYASIPTALTELDWYFPFRALISFGGEHWNVQIGRDKASWGGGITSNMMISDYSDFYNMIKFSTYWDRFKFTTIYMGLDPWLTKQESQYKADIGGDLGGDYDDYDELFKAFMAHRIEYKIRDNLSIAISEATMFGNKYINISELNPLFVFHNFFTPEYTNVMMTIEADFTPFSGFNIYLQFAMDEFQVPGLEDEDSRPGAMGLLVGFTFVKPALEGFLTFNLEAAYTDPFLYNRWHPRTRFTNNRRIWSSHLDRYEYVNKPIGYQYGPDAVVMYGAIQYEKPDKYMAAMDVKYTFLGELNDSLDYAGTYDTGKHASNLWAPSGTIERDLVFGLHGKFQLNKKISFASDIYYIHINNYQNDSGNTINDFEFTASAKFKF
ncbi:MAG: hypothetical protein FWE72_03800 [Spirochaetaceae bacterium]|nr:hypothetical protein [Spirochaetaceae bacterium]